MSFFAVAEGITVPGLQGAEVAGGGGQEPGTEDAEEDWWKCLIRFDPDTVGLGSHRCAFYILDARPSQGYSVLHTWRSEPNSELLEMHCCNKTRECWTLEKAVGENGEVVLVRYRPGSDGAGRVAVAIPATEATFSVSQNGTVTLCLPSGVVEFWRCGFSDSQVSELHRVGMLTLSSILGTNTQELLFNHLVLVGPLLLVGTSTDLWMVQLRGLVPIWGTTGTEETDEEENENEEDENRASGMPTTESSQPRHHHDGPLGRLGNREDMLDCAVPEQDGCFLTSFANQSSPSQAHAKQYGDMSSTAMVLARLSFHRPRYFLSEVQVLAVGSTWVELLLVSGQAACLYRVANLRAGTQEDVFSRSSDSSGDVAVVLRLADMGFNTKVLATAKGTSPENPWLFVLTLSGIEVWCLPPPGYRPGELSPCRLLVQRLEYRQRLDRLPPIGMLVTRKTLVLLANPPGHTPSSLPEMLFHTVPRPSLARIPELKSGVSYCARRSVEPGGAFGIGYGLVALQALPLATVYQQLRKEVKRALPLGDAAQDEGAEGDQEDFLATRFVKGELLDSSVYGIQPARVIHESGTELLTLLFALLHDAASAAQDTEDNGALYWRKEEENEDRSEKVLEIFRRMHARRLYRCLAQDCASFLGILWLEPLRGVPADMSRACDWFVKSSTPILDVCTKFFVLWHSDKSSQSEKKEEEKEGEDKKNEHTLSVSSVSTAFGAKFVAFIQRRCSRIEYEPEEDREVGKKGKAVEKGEDEEEIWQVTWPEIVTLGCDLGGEDFLDWVVLHSWLPSLKSCQELLKRLATNTRGDRRDELLSELARWT